MRVFDMSRYRPAGEPPQPGSQAPPPGQADSSYSQVPKTHRVMTLADHISVRNRTKHPPTPVTPPPLNAHSESSSSKHPSGTFRLLLSTSSRRTSPGTRIHPLLPPPPPRPRPPPRPPHSRVRSPALAWAAPSPPAATARRARPPTTRGPPAGCPPRTPPTSPRPGRVYIRAVWPVHFIS